MVLNGMLVWRDMCRLLVVEFAIGVPLSLMRLTAAGMGAVEDSMVRI